MKAFNPMRRMVRQSFSRRLIIYLSGMMMLTFCISGYVSYRIHMHLFTAELSKQFRKANEQAAARLDLQVRDIYRISNYIVFNPYVQQVLQRSAQSKERESYTQITDQDELNTLLNQIKIDEPKLYSMYLFDLNDNGFFFSNPLAGMWPLDKATHVAIKDRLAHTSGDLYWFPMKVPSAFEDSGVREVIAAARYMKTKNLEVYGIMVAIFDPTLFSEDLQGLIERDKANVYLYDKQDRLVYSDIPMTSEVASMRLSAGEELVDDGTGEPYLYVKSRSGQADFKLVSRVSLEEMQKQSAIIIQVAATLGVVSVLVGALIVTIAGNRLLRPLKQLIAGMKRVKDGDFSTQIAVRTEDELAYIGQMFNHMASNIEALIKEVYLRQLSEREAELTALQAQLNPHFMYNSLDTIYWKLYLKGERETARLVVSLSGLLRYALEPAAAQTTLGEEIRQIRAYLTIQSERFSEELETFIHVDPELEQCAMARLLLQPLVENVFVHAFADKPAGRVLRIKASKAADPEEAFARPPHERLVIEVIDNGCGIEPERVRHIVQGLPDEREPNEPPPIGVRNVIRRVDLMYGKPYGVTIQSEPGSGTTVTLVLPYKRETQPKERGVRDEGKAAYC